MDPAVQRLLTDKLYDKRKQGALELERIVREAVADKEYERIRKIVEQLCHEYAYAVHQPHARNGGLIGLAAASIALGFEEVARYLQEIVPPVLACFTDQDARVRYYACESMYNIAKVAKGEVLVFFNDIFDALCKLAADSELSVKNGAELLDRLVKDIVAESAASYVSMLEYGEKRSSEDALETDTSSSDLPMAFSLVKFIPLLQERIHVINPFTRTFLVSWLTLLDTIPDLELVYYLPDFLGGLFRFLSDPNRDVYVATQGLLERFLNEIKKIAKIKHGIEESRKSRNSDRLKGSSESLTGSAPTGDGASAVDNAIEDSDSEMARGIRSDQDGNWIPGQDVQIDYSRILDTLLQFVDTTTRSGSDTPRFDGVSREKEQEIGIVALRWIDSFFEISPEDILQFVPRLLSQVLPALSAHSDQVRTSASRVNRSLMDYIVTFQDDATSDEKLMMPPPSNLPLALTKATDPPDRRASAPAIKPLTASTESLEKTKKPANNSTPPPSSRTPSPSPKANLNYAAAVNALTLQFLNEHEATRVAALSWLIMLHRKAPGKVLTFNDGTFPALLKTLSDPAEAVVTRDLQLLSQISRKSEDGYFTSFMVNLLQLFSTDRKLLEIRGNLIIRQLCMNLVPERIYRTLAECLEKDEDIEFASIMVQNLNNNLITAPELADLRKRLRNLETKDGQIFFVALFRSWCQNAVATFSLCLLAQAYEQAYHLLQIFAELEMTVNMLIQIDKLVQLLESPVFTYLRLQLLEPDRYPYLYKCLYGLLMLLPQSSAFAALKNRLNSVSAIGLLHTPPAPLIGGVTRTTTGGLGHASGTPALAHSASGLGSIGGGGSASTTNLPGSLTSSSGSGATASTVGGGGGGGGVSVGGATMYPSRLGKRPTDPLSAAAAAERGVGGGENVIKWTELLEKFRQTQERARRRNQALLLGGDGGSAGEGEGQAEGEEEGFMGPLARSMMNQPFGGGGGRGMAAGVGMAMMSEKELPDLPSAGGGPGVIGGLRSAPLTTGTTTTTGTGAGAATAGSNTANTAAGRRGSALVGSNNLPAGAAGAGAGGRPPSVSSGRFSSSRLLTPGVGQPTVGGPGVAGGGAGTGPGHRKSKSSLGGFGRLNLGGGGGGGGGGPRRGQGYGGGGGGGGGGGERR